MFLIFLFLSNTFSFAIDFSECGVKYANRCDNTNVLLQTSKYWRVFQEICNEDTLLYAGT